MVRVDELRMQTPTAKGGGHVQKYPNFFSRPGSCIVHWPDIIFTGLQFYGRSIIIQMFRVGRIHRGTRPGCPGEMRESNQNCNRAGFLLRKFPLNPFLRIFEVISYPTFPGVREAPITAIDRG